MVNVGSVTTLPVVDLRADSDRLRQGLREAAHEVGFFYLTGHGVSQARSTSLISFTLASRKAIPAASVT